MKYLIYGASGFLGGTIYQKLKQVGHEVVGTYSTNAANNELVKVDLLNTEKTLTLYRKVKPDVVICVDALAARSMERISSTFQISDTGIAPGSGVENKREGINEKTLGVKVIAIGVPTVVDAATIAIDSIEFATTKNKYLSENKDRIIRDVLTENARNMIVTPKDIDLVIERSSKTVANGINLALHKNLSFKDIESYVG